MSQVSQIMPDSGESMNKGEWHISQVYTHTGRGCA